MQWFRNLKTMPKLMCSFGLLLAIAALVGYVGISKIRAIDKQVELLYTRDARGISEVDALALSQAHAARAHRDVILRMGNAQDVARAEQEFLQHVAEMRSHLALSDGLATTPRAKTLIQAIKQALPSYEQLSAQVFVKAKAGDRKGAIAALAAAGAPAKVLNENSVALADLKQQLAAEDRDVSAAVYKRAWQAMLSLLIGAVVVGLSLGVWIARLLAKPLVAASDVLKKISEGDFTQKLDISSQDEIGEMAKALNHVVESMRGTLAEVTESAASLSSASQELAAAASSMASGTQEQAASLEETSASIEEITATVRQNADSAKQASQLASSSRESAEKGGVVVSKAIAAMTEINASSEKIADIIGAVDEIAFQTNLLAVNAAVEAARAGEQGRGFAVVASEVRSLAQRSAHAAKEIKALIGDSVRKAKNGCELVNHSGQTLQEIVASVKRVTDIIGEIASASHEQTLGIEQVNKAMIQMDQVTQSSSAQSEELSSTAEALAAQARDLQTLVSHFRIETRGKTPTTKPEMTRSIPQAVKKSETGKSLASSGSSAKRISRTPARATDKTTESLVKLAESVPGTASQARPISVSSADFEEF